MHDLGGRPPPAGAPVIKAINNSDVIVGSIGPDSDLHAAAWIGEQLVDLNDVVTSSTFILWRAQGVNDRGQIVGYGGEYGGLNMRAFLLNPR